jgi:membrane protease YdiL (CAAX protease family)
MSEQEESKVAKVDDRPADTNSCDENKKWRGPDWPIVAFFVLAYGIAWLAYFILIFIANQSDLEDVNTLLSQGEILQLDEFSDQLIVPDWSIYLLTRIQDFSFTIAGVIMIAYVSGKAGLRELGRKLIRWRVGFRWYLFALLPLILYTLAVIVAALSDDSIISSLDLSLASAGKILFSLEAGFFVYFFTRGALGEEPGLRGFALPRLQERHSPFIASAIIGILWAGWHLPVLLDRDVASIIVFLLVAFLLSFIFTWLFNNTRQSLIPVMIFHASQNAEEMFEVLFPGLTGTDWEVVSSLGLLIIGIIIGVVLWRESRRPKGVGNVQTVE